MEITKEQPESNRLSTTATTENFQEYAARRTTFVRVALPAYNEQDSIGLLIARILQIFEEGKWLYDIVIVDDGSSDRTAEVVRGFGERYPVRLVQHEVNRGLGAAITTALNAAMEGLYDDDIIVTMDADNTHPPQLISRMVPMIREGRDIVIASRYQAGAQVVGLSRFRELMSLGASWMMRLLFGLRNCRDYTCGYRAYRVGFLRESVNRLNGQIIRETGFACMAELLLNLSRFKPVMGEAPLLLRYDMKRGASKMRIGKTIARTLRMVIRHRFGF